VAARPSASPDTSRIIIPKLNRDPIQSLCPLPLAVSTNEGDYEIPAMTAAEWLSVLMVENLSLDDIFPGLLSPDEVEQVEEEIILGSLGIEELNQLVIDIIETISARPWWVTMRLVEVARGSWDMLGAEMGMRGIDATRVSLSLWLDMLLLVAVKNMEQKDVQMFMLKLESPPPGVQSQEELEMSPEQFMALASG
jgi:hypothetical protein